MDVKSGVKLAKKLAFKDRDITLGTKALARAPRLKKGYSRFLFQILFRGFRIFRCFLSFPTTNVQLYFYSPINFLRKMHLSHIPPLIFAILGIFFPKIIAFHQVIKD